MCKLRVFRIAWFPSRAFVSLSWYLWCYWRSLNRSSDFFSEFCHKTLWRSIRRHIRNAIFFFVNTFFDILELPWLFILFIVIRAMFSLLFANILWIHLTKVLWLLQFLYLLINRLLPTEFALYGLILVKTCNFILITLISSIIIRHWGTRSQCKVFIQRTVLCNFLIIAEWRQYFFLKFLYFQLKFLVLSWYNVWDSLFILFLIFRGTGIGIGLHIRLWDWMRIRFYILRWFKNIVRILLRLGSYVFRRLRRLRR